MQFILKFEARFVTFRGSVQWLGGRCTDGVAILSVIIHSHLALISQLIASSGHTDTSVWGQDQLEDTQRLSLIHI